MAEVAGLVVGVVGLLPVIVEIIKSIRTVRSGFRTAKKCVKELDAVELDLDVQHVRFHQSCAFLIQRCGEDSRTADDMIGNPNHDRWNDHYWEDRLIAALGQRYGLYLRFIEAIRDKEKELVADLSCFDEARWQKVKGESVRSSFKRLKASVGVAFDKSALETKIDWLRKRNEDLESLQRCFDDKQQKKACMLRCSSRKPLPQHFSDVQEISEEAYGALTASFSCGEESHDEHSASLCLDAELVEEIRLSMAITYKSGHTLEPPVRFLLQSQTIQKLAILQPDCCPTTSYGGEVQLPTQDHVALPCSSTTVVAKKRKGVAFLEEKDSPKKQAIVASARHSNETTGPTINLHAIQSVCRFLREKCRCTSDTAELCKRIASFQKPNLPRYIFYVSVTQEVSYQVRDILAQQTVSLYDFLQTEREEAVTNVHQFKLALKLTLAVLQYHSTSWLDPEWRLSQLMLMSNSSELPEEFSLYLNSRLQNSKKSTLTNSEIQMTETTKNSMSQQRHRGIDNMTLFCLGLAFLEIGNWKPLSALRRDYDADDIDTARRIGSGKSVLGKAYQKMTERLLRCDFGFGADLSTQGLQSAVYNEVVCPLEDVIAKLNDLEISDE
ncbi:hypothetical protein EJ08DRAFT_635987 [Tothia fuscella]|uniref:DUF7580 domain-containing protein n=1 Tax=Tothia fuscella TaxID=1048955 RepID=A0A9P4TX79_9PEZI|nr:hypothetical protein EJ08DRAFT_635987 [Tothia fuscella]